MNHDQIEVDVHAAAEDETKNLHLDASADKDSDHNDVPYSPDSDKADIPAMINTDSCAIASTVEARKGNSRREMDDDENDEPEELDPLLEPTLTNGKYNYYTN